MVGPGGSEELVFDEEGSVSVWEGVLETGGDVGSKQYNNSDNISAPDVTELYT